jgi:CBS domain-containing protein
MYCPACGTLNLPGNDSCGNCRLPLAHLDEPALHDRVERSLMTDHITVLEPRSPCTVSIDTTVGAALNRMIELTVGALLVTGPEDRLVGILTERDFLAKIAGQPGFEKMSVREFMTAEPETVSPTDTLAFALSKMDAGGYRHLPVVLDGKPVGMISVRDILRHLTNLCEETP